MADPAALAALARLLDVMHQLRAPGGCPWDREQTRESLRPYLLEEAYEVLDAIDRGDAGDVRDELGDLLLQIVFHAEIATEAGEFDMAAIAGAITAKLERRHPHVFGDTRVRDADEVAANWARIKADERRARGVAARDDAVPRTLPALARAQAIGAQVGRDGLDWPDVDGPLAKLREEHDELAAAIRSGDRAAIARELGDVLLTATSVARHVGTSAELALRDATERLRARARRIGAAAAAAGRPLAALSPAEVERLWQAAKRRD